MIINVEWFNKRSYNVSNTQLEKKFEQYNTLEKDKHDIRRIFQLADDQRKFEMITHIDYLLQKFNDIHENIKKEQIIAIEEWIKDIFQNLSIFRNDKKVVDVLAALD